MSISICGCCKALRRSGSEFARVPFLAAILPYDDVLRFRDVINDDTRARSRARSGESLGIEAVALAVLVDT